jgi:hypothetical protein
MVRRSQPSSRRCGKRMPQRVAVGRLGPPYGLCGLFAGSLPHRFVGMMPGCAHRTAGPGRSMRLKTPRVSRYNKTHSGHAQMDRLF